MKTPLLYGSAMAVAGTLVTLVEYLLGFHNDMTRFATGQTIGTIAGIVISIVGLILVMRMVRDTSSDGSLSYGKAVATGALTSLSQGVVGGILTYVYGALINPEFHELVFENARRKLSADQAQAAEGMLRFFTGPLWFLIVMIFVTPILGTLFSLIIGAFMKRPPRTPEPPPLAAA
ncbi:MAG: DUF4199 domain-containing protein [Opitutaceae bacterium]|nr:DUF4199 domain-containing protein [Opitutaceae bacterium]